MQGHISTDRGEATLSRSIAGFSTLERILWKILNEIMLSLHRHMHFPRILNHALYYNLVNYVNIDAGDIEESKEETADNYGYAPNTFDIISHSHIDLINSKQRKKIDKMEDEISIHLQTGFQVYEYDKVPIWNPSTLFQVGHRNQFNEFAADNMFKLFETFLFPITQRNQWTIPKAMKNELRLKNIASVIDYHPFEHTLSGKQTLIDVNNKKKKKTTKSLQTDWKFAENQTFGYLKDSFGANMPYLMNRDDRELLIWRDSHDAICNMRNVQRVIKGYKPDIIVLEGQCDESSMKIYGKSSFNLYLSFKNYFHA